MSPTQFQPDFEAGLPAMHVQRHEMTSIIVAQMPMVLAHVLATYSGPERSTYLFNAEFNFEHDYDKTVMLSRLLLAQTQGKFQGWELAVERRDPNAVRLYFGYSKLPNISSGAVVCAALDVSAQSLASNAPTDAVQVAIANVAEDDALQNEADEAADAEHEADLADQLADDDLADQLADADEDPCGMD